MLLTTLTVATICATAAAATYVLASCLDRAFPTGKGFGVLPTRED